MAKRFVFRSNQSIGAAQAELDARYLSECFVDTGDLAVVRDCGDPRRIVAGRTGAGKSALLSRLADIEGITLSIRPESLSLGYIANSNVINFFAQLGVKMDIFYRLLWRHVLVVEILKARFRIYDDAAKRNFLQTLWGVIPRKKQHELALDYLREWGESFWQETEYRVQEITSKLEHDLETSVEATIKGVGGISGGAARKLSEEQRQEVIHRGQEVVNRVQVVELSRVIDLLDEVLLEDRQKRYFILIDKLDEDWVEERLRYQLIRALIETSLDFARIKNVKVVLAARNDLLDRVYRFTRDSGFQEEKYRTSTLEIRWTRDQLIEILDSRIGALVRDKYISVTVSHRDILPQRVGRQPAIDYILERTLMRPRDIIQFFNSCISQSDGKPFISERALRQAEGVYSRERLRALGDEWYGLYPNLLHLSRLLKRGRDAFQVSDIPLDRVEENYLELLVSGQAKSGIDMQMMNMVFEAAMSLQEYRANVVFIFYRVGLVGLKTDPFAPVSWSDLGGVSVSSAEVRDDTKAFVHKAFWRCLGIGSLAEDSTGGDLLDRTLGAD